MTVENKDSAVESPESTSDETVDAVESKQTETAVESSDSKDSNESEVTKQDDKSSDSGETNGVDIEAIQNQLKTMQKELEKMSSVNQELIQSRDKMKEKLQADQIDNAVTKALEGANVAGLDTAKKLIDRSQVEFDDRGNIVSDSISKLVDSLRESDPILFKTSDGVEEIKQPVNKGPSVARPGDTSDMTDAYQKELDSCTTVEQIAAVVKKYRK